MTIPESTHLNPITAVGDTTTPPAAKTPEDTAGFRRLLESLERLAKEHRTAAPVADAGSVQDAVARADEGFTLAMDLRRQLENAFRQRMP